MNSKLRHQKRHLKHRGALMSCELCRPIAATRGVLTEDEWKVCGIKQACPFCGHGLWLPLAPEAVERELLRKALRHFGKLIVKKCELPACFVDDDPSRPDTLCTFKIGDVVIYSEPPCNDNPDLPCEKHGRMTITFEAANEGEPQGMFFRGPGGAQKELTIG